MLRRRRSTGGRSVAAVGAMHRRRPRATPPRPLFAAPGTLDPRIGFRVVRAEPDVTGDLNGDAQTNLADLQGMLTCLGGPGVIQPPQCDSVDFDLDADADLRDAAAFQRAMRP